MTIERGASRQYGRKRCVIEGCGRPHLARGWCSLHLQRWRATGDPLTEPPGEPPETRTCQQCGEQYTVGAAYARQRGSKFCSRRCAQQAKAPKPRTCAWCKTEFTAKNPGALGTGRYCSQKCWRDHQHQIQPRSFTFTCRQCGAEFVRSASQVRQGGKPKYCSRACQGLGRVRLESERSRGPGWRRRAKEIRSRDGHRCVRCDAPEDGRLHAVDHIVPWVLMKSRPELANADDNLATLCISCHGTKTATTEPRMLRGDFLALREFYGEERAQRAQTLFNQIGRIANP